MRQCRFATEHGDSQLVATCRPQVVKLKEENLMYSAMREKEVQEQKECPDLVFNLAVRLGINNDIKKARFPEQFPQCTEAQRTSPCQVKAANLRLEVPDGWEAALPMALVVGTCTIRSSMNPWLGHVWPSVVRFLSVACRLAGQEHWDEHLGRHYYVNKATQKVTWKHPTVTNQRGKFGQVDDQEEMEGQFNLQALVKKVEEMSCVSAAMTGTTREDVDSDDGLHDIVKPKKKKQKKEKAGVQSLHAITQSYDEVSYEVGLCLFE
eukprot:Skav215559  [mRNA]  locus=scaffold3091:266771:270168:- [translate_table: standard]